MLRRTLLWGLGTLLLGCGKQSEQVQALKQLADAGTALTANQDEAERFQKDRVARGDTLALPYAELQKLLPPAPSGYTATEAPAGSSQNMPGFSTSQAEQTFALPAGPDGNAPSLHVILLDFGGTTAGYSMMAMPLMALNLSSEDAHHRMRTLKLDQPYTWAAEEYNKDSKEAKVTAVTRYRFMITVEARNYPDDQTAMLRGMVEDLVKQFANK